MDWWAAKVRGNRIRVGGPRERGLWLLMIQDRGGSITDETNPGAHKATQMSDFTDKKISHE